MWRISYMWRILHFLLYAQNRLCMLTVSKSEAENSNILKLRHGQFVTDSQGWIPTSDGDPRTGTFPQKQFTAGDTACSVKGVLQISSKILLVFVHVVSVSFLILCTKLPTDLPTLGLAICLVEVDFHKTPPGSRWECLGSRVHIPSSALHPAWWWMGALAV